MSSNLIERIKKQLHLARDHDVIPEGTFMGPEFFLDRRENHGMGYHCHIIRSKSGKRMPYLVTIKDGKVFLTNHNGSNNPNHNGSNNPNILKKKSMQKVMGSYVSNNLKPSIEKHLGSIPNHATMTPGRKSTFLYNM